MTQFHLLHKTELRIGRISVQNANLNDIAAVVADTLGLERDRVLVTDLWDDTITLDGRRAAFAEETFTTARLALIPRSPCPWHPAGGSLAISG